MSDYSSNNILFVDDEVNILRSLRRGLIKEPYGKFFAKSGIDALDILAQEDIHVIITDMRMPGMTGLELLNIVHDKYPDIVKIVLSGYAQLPQVLATVNQVNIFKFITKPWNLENDLRKVILEAFNYYNLKYENEVLKISLGKKNALYQKLLRDNDSKIMTMKRDLKLVSSLQTEWSNVLRQLSYEMQEGAISSEDFEDMLDIADRLFAGIMSNMPTDVVQLKFSWLIDEVNLLVKRIQRSGNQVEEKPDGEYVKFYGYETVDHLLSGAHQMLLFCFKLVFEWLLLAREPNTFSVIVREEVSELKGKSKIVFLIHEDQAVFQQNQRIIELVDMSLSLTLGTINGRYQVMEKDGKTLIAIETLLDIVSEE